MGQKWKNNNKEQDDNSVYALAASTVMKKHQLQYTRKCLTFSLSTVTALCQCLFVCVMTEHTVWYDTYFGP